MTASAERLLARLDGARTSGHGWTARCPGHEDRSASLSIAIGEDGRILLHCFAGCATADVLAAVGLTLGDLFERRITHTTSPAQRAELLERARQADWRAALGVLGREATIVLILASDILTGRSISEADQGRLVLAVDRIQGTRGVLCV